MRIGKNLPLCADYSLIVHWGFSLLPLKQLMLATVRARSDLLWQLLCSYEKPYEICMGLLGLGTLIFSPYVYSHIISSL